jgi:adenylate cyclase
MTDKKEGQSRPRKKTPAAGEIRAELERILESPEFKASQRSKDFLRFVVEETQAGRSHTVKGYTIATRVFGREKDFNPVLDPIVRIEAGKLRRALERYYLLTGAQNPIRIEIRKGSYIPAYYEQPRIEPDRKSWLKDASAAGFDGSWPLLLVRPLQNMTGNPDKDYLGIGLATELATEISRFQEIRVLLEHQEGQQKRVPEGVARFVIEGTVREDKTGIKLTVQLMDAPSNRQIWSDTHRSALEAARLIAFEEKIAQELAAKIAGEYGIVAKTLSQETKDKPPAQLRAYEAILRYYEWDRTLTTESFLRAKDALEYAVRIEPECGQIWGMLGRLYATIYSLEFPGFENALSKAREYAQKGVRLNPENQRCRATLALVLMFSDEIDAALIEADRALALNPHSLFMLGGIGYLLTLLGDWERGPDLIRKVMRQNPYYTLYVHYALWLDWVRRKDYEKAHLETLNFRRPAVFWESLMQAATFGLLGRYEEGKRAVEHLLRLKPNFPTRGRTLIKHYIKFDDIVDRVIAGLAKAGLKVV